MTPSMAVAAMTTSMGKSETIRSTVAAAMTPSLEDLVTIPLLAV